MSAIFAYAHGLDVVSAAWFAAMAAGACAFVGRQGER